MNEKDILKAILKAASPSRPDWLPSEAWENLERNRAVINSADADRIEKGIESAGKERIAAMLSVITGVLEKFAPGIGGLIG